MSCSPTYLSVDLDNWLNREFPSNFLNKIKKLEVPVAVSVHHHELLPHVNYPATKDGWACSTKDESLGAIGGLTAALLGWHIASK